MKKPYKRKESLVTVVGTSYIEHIVPEMVVKCFDIYCKRDFSQKNFQSSVLENSFATAGIVLTVLTVEAYRNRIFYLENKKVGKDVPKDLANIFDKKDSNFDKDKFKEIMSEIFVLRDLIVHNHIYKVDVYFDKEYEMLGHRQTLLEGYGDNKFKKFSSSRAKKTINLKLNVQPAKIGFEDLFTTLVVFDTFVGIANKLLSRSYVPFNFWYEINKNSSQDFYKFLNLFYDNIPNRKYLQNSNKIFIELEKLFKSCLSDVENYFITNKCPTCRTLGLHKFDNSIVCNKCGFKVVPIRSTV